MELDIVDQLLTCLVDQSRNVPLAMRERGYTQEQISEAWTAARAAQYTESTGLGMDRLTPAGQRGRQQCERLNSFQAEPSEPALSVTQGCQLKER